MHASGKMRMLTLQVYPTAAISAFTKIGEVSSGNRPAHAITSNCTTTGSSVGLLDINASGRIRIRNVSAATNYYLTVVYMVS